MSVSEEKEKIAEEVERSLKERGLKLTETRKKVIRYLIEYGRHFEIEDLVLWIRERCRDFRNCPSRPSVYRTVKILEELGYVKPVLKQGNKTLYEFLPVKGEHYHLLCIGCGKLVEFKSKELERIVKEVAKSFGFKYLHHHLEVCGLCPECQRKEDLNTD